MTPASLGDLQASLGGTLRIERELGGGGMSRVFVATDPALDRRVVIKVFSAELAQGISIDRFTREIRLAAALQDPHIVQLLSAGTTSDGLPYYTMPFVEGESLRARMGRGPLTLDESLRILRDVAEALEYAHQHGVVHRDIKPDNVLLAGRAAIVADFGIAKAMIDARTTAPGGTLTQVGSSIGTPAYMAPEQAAGDPTDHRADLYAWGMLAYELLAGAHPFAHKSSTQQLIAAQIAEMPKPLDGARPGLPVPLSALVMRCLAKEPAKRPADASEILSALSALGSSGTYTPFARTSGGRRRMYMVGGAVALLLAVGGVVYARRAAAPPASGENTLVVLPFEHQGDAAENYVTDGITDEIRGKLTSVHGVSVIARASSNQYRTSKKSPQDIASELGVRYLLTGTVRVVGTGDQRRVLVRPELVEVMADGRPESRWQQPFDAPAADMIRVQSDVAGQVVSAMQVEVGGADRAQLVRVATRDPVAYDLYLRGRAANNMGQNADGASQRAAIPFFKQALERDSLMIDAWVALVGAQSVLYFNGTPSAKLAEEARVAAERAFALDPKGAAGNRAMGTYHRLVARDPEKAVREMETAYRLQGGEAAVLNSYAYALEESGRADEALTLAKKGAQLDPRNANTRGLLARLSLQNGDVKAARNMASESVVLAPTSLTALTALVSASLADGDTAAAKRAIQDATSRIPPASLLPHFGTFGLSWLLDSVSRAKLLALSPADYGGDRATWALVRARDAWWHGDSLARRVWGDTAAKAFTVQARDVPADATTRSDLAEALGHAGRKADAIREAKRSVQLTSEQNKGTGRMYYAGLMNAASSVAVAGARDEAIAWLTEARTMTAEITPARLRVDPIYMGLRGDPRFEQMAKAQTAAKQ